MTRASALRRLTVLHLRGAVGRFALDFEPGTRLTIVYGENGTGKSTICDAFDLMASGAVGSLAERGLGKTQEYWASLGKPSSAIEVTLEAADGTCHATVQRSEVVAKGGTRPRVMVLRRAQILSVVQATDGDRYKAVQRFIDVAAVEASEATLLTAMNSVNASLDLAATRIQEQRESISHYHTSNGSPGVDPLVWAEREVGRATAASAAEVKALEAGRTAYQRLHDATVSLGTAERSATNCAATLADARAAYERAVSDASMSAGDVVALLEAARTHLLNDPTPAVCPVCESADGALGLATRIDARLAAFTAVRSTRAVLDNRQAEAERAAESLKSARATAIATARALDDTCAAPTWPVDVERPSAMESSDLAMRETWLSAHEHLLERWRLAGTKRETASAFTVSLRLAWKTYTENLAASAELSVLLPSLRRAHEIVAEERRRFTDGVLAEIAVEVGRMYEAVHPGEGLDKISLALDPKRRASLSIASSFLGKEGVPPAAYLSESHIDTLGLCVFLALAAREAPGEAILVLDDPLASIDAPHADRTIEMLYEEATRFRHCVITTHFKPWREKYRWGKLRTGECQFVELTRWSASGGLTLVGTVPELERLRRLLADSSPDLQLVCAKAGVVLEAGLDFLTTQYRCAVPRSMDGRYTLDELLSAVNGKLRKALAVERAVVQPDGSAAYTRHELATHLDALSDIAKVRNVVGCHFNELSFESLDGDALEFGRQVLGLMDLLTDDGAWPGSGKSGLYWATRNETRRLYPPKKPS